MKEKDPLTIVIILCAIFALATFTFGFMFSPERPEMETRERGKLLHFEGSNIVVEIITIDGVEYIVTKCRDGVGVCRK
tara:strand:- start:1235 stop:1468 length:234 start_codon:yes stop_codon:yes gene_type:complete